MRITPNEPTPQFSIEQLLDLAAEWTSKAGDSLGTDICDVKVRTCLEFARAKLAREEQEISMAQIQLTREANALTEKLLKSNDDAGIASANNAAALNSATEQLAKSTAGLNRATWILAVFTGIQVLIASVSLWLSLRGK
jgi:hypothetical protein